jgi:hypothetical protein
MCSAPVLTPEAYWDVCSPGSTKTFEEERPAEQKQQSPQPPPPPQQQRPAVPVVAAATGVTNVAAASSRQPLTAAKHLPLPLSLEGPTSQDLELERQLAFM